MPIDLSKRAFTVDEYHRMADSNIFQDERVELVEGEVIAMTPMGSRHAACIARLNQLLMGKIDEAVQVRVQLPLPLNQFTELEPDLALVHSRDDFYSAAHPSAEDTLLVIEVAESSLSYDGEVKLPLYARSGVPEVWLVNLTEQLVSTCSSPSPNGYELVTVKHAGEVLELSSSPQLRVNVADILL